MEGIKKIAAMVILKSGSRYLLLKRGKAPNIGKYLPVGGRLEPHETPFECAIRETYEETGIRIEHPRFCGMLTESSATDYNWISYIYLADIEAIEAPFCEEGILEWIDAEMLDKIDTPPTDLLIYQYVDKKLNFAFSAKYDNQLNLIEMWEEMTAKKVLPGQS
jgi:8-oxo-dGTP diphosphatase